MCVCEDVCVLSELTAHIDERPDCPAMVKNELQRDRNLTDSNIFIEVLNVCPGLR